MPARKTIDQVLNYVHSHQINPHTREIYLHGAYFDSADGNCDEPGVEYRMATTFIKNLHVLEQFKSGDNILVHMHTIGGSWADGMAMYQTIRFLKSPVTFVAYAQASSMSGILLQGADKRIMMPDCEFMIHHGSLSIADNSMAVKSAVDQNERSTKRMLEIFAERAIHGPFFKEKEWDFKHVMDYIDKKIKEKSDWYMSAEEAVYYGFADAVYGQPGARTVGRIRTKSKFKFKSK